MDNKNDLSKPIAGYLGLLYHMEEAYEENMLDIKNASKCPLVAIFSKKYYNEINNLSHNKKYDYCFIGNITPFSLKNGTLFNKKNIIAPFQA